MNSALPVPALSRVLGILGWELIWKNRVVLPALAVFLGLGVGLSQAVSHADPLVWWANYARGTGFIAFLASILLSFAPFTLMDSHGSWRMNSVTSRWSILPVRTVWLVGVPLLLAWAWLALLGGAWAPILNRLIPGLDTAYMMVVLSTGVVAAQAVAWAVPRKPSQYWALAGLIFVLALLCGVLPQDKPDWESHRWEAIRRIALLAVALTGVAIWAAQRNRCGDWPGEVPLTGLRDRIRLPWATGRPCHSRFGALFASDVAPPVWNFVLTWVALILIIVAWGILGTAQRHPGRPIPVPMILLGLVGEALPTIGVLWLMGWGLFLGCEPGMGFATRLSGYRATQPLTAGALAATRVCSIVLAWLCVWVPLLIAQRVWLADTPEMRRMFGDDLARQISQLMAGRMAFSATAVVGALPIILWGRWEGFPTLFLATLVAWACSWGLIEFVHQDPIPAWLPSVLCGLVLLKLLVAIGALIYGCRRGYVSHSFAVILPAGWLLTVAAMYSLFPTWQAGGVESALGLAAVMPILRFSLCPLAMAANRHG